MFEEAYLCLLKKNLFLKNYLAILAISSIFSIKCAWKKRKIFSRHIFSWNAYCSTVILFSSFKKLTISKRCCTMEKKNGSYNEKSSEKLFSAAVLWKYSEMGEFCKSNQTNHSYFILKLHFAYLPYCFIQHGIFHKFRKEKWCQAGSHLGDTSRRFQNILQ